MEPWQRQRIALQLGSLVTMAVLGIVFYRPDQPYWRQLFMRPLVSFGMLALIFVPILVGIYFGRDKTPKS